MKKLESSQRVAFSPGEFAALFGKSQTWGYRALYSGRVKAITEHGRIMIPVKEVERLLESAGIYNGKEKPKEQKARLAKLPAKEQSAWLRFIAARKGGSSGKRKASGSARVPESWNKHAGQRMARWAAKGVRDA